jgi:sec-independent protein translocase protein TatB
MFGISGGEFITLVVIGMILLGPDRLPHAARDLAKAIRKFRELAAGVSAEFKENLGPGFEDLAVTDLHPRNLIKKGLAGEFDEVISSASLAELKQQAKIDPDLL